MNWKPPTSDKQIRKLEVGKKHRIDHVLGLYIRLSRAAPSRGGELVGYWSIRTVIAGEPREIGLDAGTFPQLDLDAAYKAARAVWVELDKDQDPIIQRRQDRAEARQRAQQARHDRQMKRRGHKPAKDGETLADIATAFYEAHSPNWRKNTEIAWSGRQNNHVGPLLGELDPLTITTADVLRLLQKDVKGKQFWHRHPHQAEFVRQHLQNLLDYAYSRKEITKLNPARWEGHLQNLLAGFDDDDTQTNVPIPIERFPAFIRWLRQIDGTVPRCLEFLALTAARSHMAVNAHWGQIDLQKRLWSLTAAEMKGDRDHMVPLCPDLLTLLEALPRHPGGLLFPSIRLKVASTHYMRDLLHQFDPNASLHGLRSDFAIFCQRMSIPTEVREIALAHVHAGKVARKYASDLVLDQRRVALTKFALFAAGKLDLPKLDTELLEAAA